MKKNVAGQKIGAQMITAADGTPFTGSVTVYVTGDAGTQAIGSVGSGVCTHEGNGYHTYAPAQAETNYDLIAFTFVGSGAINSTVQVFASFPQSADAPTAAAIRSEIDSNSTKLDATISSRASAANLATAITYIDTEVAAILTIAAKLDTALELDGSVYRFTVNALEQAPAGGSGLDAAGVRAALGMDTANLDTQLDALPTAAEVVAALLAAVLTESYRADGAAGTIAQLLYELVAHMGESSISGTTKTIKKIDGSTVAATFTLNDATTPTAITRAS